MQRDSVTIPVSMDAKQFRRFGLFDTFILRRRWLSPAVFSAIFIAFSVLCFSLTDKEQSALLGSVLLAVGIGLPACYFLNFFLQLTAFLIVSVLDMDFYPSILSLPVEALIMTMVMALFCGVAPLFFLFWGMRTIGSEKAGIIGVSELPFTLVVAFLVLGETMDGLQLIGIFLVVLAVLVLQKDM